MSALHRVLLGVVLMGIVGSAEAGVFKSAYPLFFKLAMDPQGATNLLFAIDESQGTGSGYDVLYWDTNHDERWQPREKRQAESGNGPAVFLVPMPYALFPAPVSEEIKKKLAARVMVYSLGSMNPTVMVTLSLKLTREAEEWNYSLTASGLAPAKTIAAAPILHAGPITVIPTVRADTDCGLAARLEAADYSLSCSGPDGASSEIGILITDTEGRTVHRDNVSLGRLGFG